MSVEKVRDDLKLEEVMEMDQNGTLKRDFYYPPVKDTLVVPTGGYAVIRFVANNPGVWLAHCHLLHHNDGGMMFLFKVGTDVNLPKEPIGWPKCKSFRGDDESILSVSGRVFHVGDGPQLEPDARLDLRVYDSTIADIPSLTLAELTITNLTQFPVAYELSLDANKIVNFGFMYGISARVTNKDGRLIYVSDTFTPIIENNAIKSAIDIEVIRVIDYDDPDVLAASRATLSGVIRVKSEAAAIIEPNSTIKLNIIDASIMDVAAVNVAEMLIDVTTITYFPIRFAIDYDKSKLKLYGRYSLSIRIERKDKSLLYLNDEYISIMNNTNNEPLSFVNASVIQIEALNVSKYALIEGEISCSSEARIEPNSTLKVTVLDVTLMDVGAVKIAERVLTELIGSFPIKYAIYVERSKINREVGQYSIGASVTTNGRLKFVNDESISILNEEDDSLLSQIDFSVISLIPK